MKTANHVNMEFIYKVIITQVKKVVTTILISVSVASNSQTGIGTLSPDKSSQLEVFSNNKGILIPKITLTGETDQASIEGGKAAISLLVYNTGLNPNFPAVGFMFWNGSRWRLLINGNTVKAKIDGGLIKKTAILTPNSYTAGVNYKGVLEVSYNGGNGGYYSEEKVYDYNGLSFTLQPGQAVGTGKLTYEVTGKPTVSSPNPINNVPIRFLNNSLGNIDIGGSDIAVAVQYTLHTSIPKIAQIGTSSASGTGANNGYGGSYLTWRKDDNLKIESIVLPETGAYVFSFRLYGPAGGTTPDAGPFYISALKQTGSTPSDRPFDTLLDIAEITLVKPSGYANYTYSINLTASGQAGERVYFKITGAANSGITWGLSNGSDGLDYGTLANRTSMFFWKL